MRRLRLRLSSRSAFSLSECACESSADAADAAVCIRPRPPAPGFSWLRGRAQQQRGACPVSRAARAGLCAPARMHDRRRVCACATRRRARSTPPAAPALRRLRAGGLQKGARFAASPRARGGGALCSQDGVRRCSAADRARRAESDGMAGDACARRRAAGAWGTRAHDAVRGQMAAPDLGRSRSTQHTTTIAAEAVTAARPAQRRRTNPSRPAAAGATAPASSSRQRAGWHAVFVLAISDASQTVTALSAAGSAGGVMT